MITMAKGKIGEFMERAWLRWQLEEGEKKSLSEFADALGCSQSYLSMVIAGRRKPSEEMVNRWSPVVGPEIYDLLGLERPDPQLRKLRVKYDAIPPDDVDAFFEWIDEFMRARGYERDDK